MTPRPLARMRPHAALLAASACGLLALAGCDPRMALYFLQPFEPKIAAPCPPLKGKKVVILTSAVPGTQNDFPTIDRDVTRELAAILRDKVKKVDVVSPDEVFAWAQAHPTSTDPAEAARAFEADVVVFLEIRRFEIQSPSSPGLFEGRSSVHIQVTELAHPKDDRGRPIVERPRESGVIHEDDRETAFPVTGAIPASAEVTAATFKNKFLKLVVSQISWHLVDHAPGDDIQDTKFNGQ
jgi:hypothetical protein